MQCGSITPSCCGAQDFLSAYALGREAVQEAMFAKLRGIRNFERRSSLKTWRLSILDHRARSLIEKLLLPILVGSSSAKKRMTLHPIHIVACSPVGIPGTPERVVME